LFGIIDSNQNKNFYIFLDRIKGEEIVITYTKTKEALENIFIAH
jgi:hypothetical protein